MRAMIAANASPLMKPQTAGARKKITISQAGRRTSRARWYSYQRQYAHGLRSKDHPAAHRDPRVKPACTRRKEDIHNSERVARKYDWAGLQVSRGLAHGVER
jgi:hypothetical protein